MGARRKHGKRSVVARLARIRSAIKRAEQGIVERDVKMELAHALLSVQQCRKFILNAERLAARTL